MWVKVYKHSWFGVFPYFLSSDIDAVSMRLAKFCSPAREVPAWLATAMRLNVFRLRLSERSTRMVMARQMPITTMH